MPEDVEGTGCPHAIIPTLTVKDAARVIEFYKKAFGAEELMRMPGPGGQGVMHAELQIGDSIIFLSDEFPEMGGKSPQTLGGATGGIYLSVPDVDAVFDRAIEAGAQQEMAVSDMFWGDRMGSIVDPAGHHWMLATHKEDVSPEEMKRRSEEFYKQMEARTKEEGVEASI
jgi:PhnB protein